MHQRGHQLENHRILRAQHVRVAHGAAHDAAQHVAAAFVGRQHAVGDQERRGTQMVGDHLVRGRLRTIRVDAGLLRHRFDQAAEQVDVVVVVLALQDGGDALQAHAGIDRRPRQADALFLGHLLELHEDKVPDLDEAVAILVGAARRAARDAVAVVVEDLRAGTARTGIAHGPEIVRGRDADDAVVAEAGNLLPLGCRVVVGVEHRDQQLVLGEAEIPRQQVPGQLDRLVLEVVAEREVAQHLEEGVMPGGVADILEIVVLAPGAHALLRGRGAAVGALLQAGEDVLELHHAGVGEHQRGIVARHERARGYDLVAVLAEVF